MQALFKCHSLGDTFQSLGDHDAFKSSVLVTMVFELALRPVCFRVELVNTISPL